MEDSDDGPTRKSHLQRVLRVGLGLLFFAIGAFTTAAIIIGFDAAHSGWQDYLLFVLPVPWLICATIIFTYRAPTKTSQTALAASKPSQSRPSRFRAAIGLCVFGGMISIPWALDWGGVVREAIVTVGAILVLLLLSRVFKEATQRRSTDPDRPANNIAGSGDDR